MLIKKECDYLIPTLIFLKKKTRKKPASHSYLLGEVGLSPGGVHGADQGGGCRQVHVIKGVGPQVHVHRLLTQVI